MGSILIVIIHAVISFAVGKAVVNSKPEIANWSINKKQAITLIWFFLSVLFWAVIKTIQLNSSIEEHIFSSFGTSIIMGMIFYYALKPKKQTA
jgi:hypothetical protein